LYCGIVAAFFNAAASSHARADTFVVVFRTEEATVIAADSKIGATQGHDGGNTCKIHITNEITWATTGIVKEVNGPFDLWAIAEAATQGGTLNSIVSRFERNAIDQLKETLPRIKSINPESYANAIKTGYVATAVFIYKNDLRIVFFKVPHADIPSDIEVVRNDCPGEACPVGVSTLLMGEHGAIDYAFQPPSTFFKEKGLIGGLNYLVDVQHGVTPKDVGAPVSILRIDKSGALSWLQKGMCD